MTCAIGWVACLFCQAVSLTPPGPAGTTFALAADGAPVPMIAGHDADFARLASDAPVALVLRPLDGQTLGDVRIRPRRLGLSAVITDSAATITLPVPSRVVVNVGFRRKLIVFVEPPEPPAPAGPLVSDASKLPDGDYQPAIDALPDGGTLYFPPGVYRSGSLKLKSNMTLHLAGGALLQAVDDPARIARFRDGSYRAFLIADGCRNLTISGRGTVDANGYVIRKAVEAEIGRKMPGRALLAVGCANLTIEDVLVRDSYSWMVHLVDCEQVTLRRVGIFADLRLSNGDGLDVDGCRDLLAEDCFIVAEDDAISVKAAWTARNPERNTFRRCTLWSQNATGIRLGTESKSEAFRDLRFEGLDILRANSMVRIFDYEGALMSGLEFVDLTTEELSLHVAPRYDEIRRIAEQAGGTTYLLQCIVRPGKDGRCGQVGPLRIAGWTAYEAASSMLRAYDVPAGVEPYRDVTVAGLTIAGQPARDAAALKLSLGGFEDAVSFEDQPR